jgi:Bacterial Ig domain
MAAPGRTDAWRSRFRFPALALAFLAALVLLPPGAQAEPNLTFTAPTKSKVSGNVSWSAVAGGPRRIAKVELLVDGTVVEADRSAPYGGWWDTTRDFDGDHELHVRAYDVGGKAATRAKSVEVANASAPPANIAGGVAMMGSQLANALEPGHGDRGNAYWSSYLGADAPEGGSLGWMPSGAAELSANITLPRPLQPGKHWLYVEGFNYGYPIDVRLSIGAGTSTVRTDDRDSNGTWSVAAPLTVRTPSDHLTLTLRKTGPPATSGKFLLTGLYATADASQTVLASDLVVDLDFPTRMDSSKPRPGNVIENSSFEAGLGHGWGLSENRQFSLRSTWDGSQGRIGNASVRLPLDPAARSYGEQVSLISKAYGVRPNRKYTLAAWVKTDRGAMVSGALSLVNSFSDRRLLPAGFHPPHRLDRRFTVGDRWTRISVTGYLLDYPTADYHVDIGGMVSRGRHLWIDGVSVTEGEPVPYSPKLPLEIGLRGSQQSNLYYEDEPALFELRAANATPSRQSGTARYVVYDYMDRKVKAGSVDLSTGAWTTAVRDLDLGSGRSGSFRVLLWIDGVEGSEEEVLFGVVPRPQVAGRDPSSSMGIHSNFRDFQYDTLEKLGFKWDRAMSPSALFRWELVERVDDQFAWNESRVNTANRRGFQVLGTLGAGSWPHWALAGGRPKLDEWKEFVEQAARHYRGRVQAWEVWNEPNHAFQPDLYARMLKLAAEAIRRNDPNARVVSMGGASEPDYMISVIRALERDYPNWKWRDHLDVLSTHFYPSTETTVRRVGAGTGDEFRERIMRPFGKSVWNTEAGQWDSGFFHTSNGTSPAWGQHLFPFQGGSPYTQSSPIAVENVAINFIETVGNGLNKYFYYDFRTAPSPSLFESHPSALEYDDSIRPKAIALSVLAKRFDHSQGLGRLTSEEDQTRAFLFDRRGTPLIALYSVDNANRSVALDGLAPDQIVVYDVMGNRLPLRGPAIRFGRQPIYIEGQGITVETLRTAFERGVAWNRPDLIPPKVTINGGPRGSVPAGVVSFAWGATDDTYTPDLSDQDAIAYSYRVEGSARYDAWSAWSGRMSTLLAGLPSGQYRFEVKAKDAAGNESPPVSRSFAVR